MKNTISLEFVGGELRATITDGKRYAIFSFPNFNASLGFGLTVGIILERFAQGKETVQSAQDVLAKFEVI